jgi:CopA family copper-resistance protein
MRIIRPNFRPATELSRRRFVLGATAAVAGVISPWSRAEVDAGVGNPPLLQGNRFDLGIGYQGVNFTGRDRIATTVNQSLPAPTLRWREGQQVSLRVSNSLAHDTSIHWHGMILPTHMDGVPGISFPGIGPGESFEYRFDVRQSGTYWYHSHSGFQEQTGLYGAIIIDPLEPEPFHYDREFVVMLSDWSDEEPESVYRRLKIDSEFYSQTRWSVSDLQRELKARGLSATWQDRSMWNRMRMSNRDLSDVSGLTYTYLMNGVTPDRGWTGVFKRGEKIRLRVINGSAMSFFDFRIPGLKMTVVATDGQNVEPVTVDEFRIGTAETYDVLVEPESDVAYTLFAQAMDRSGFARGTLTPDLSLSASVPEIDAIPSLNHGDMGMSMAAMGHAGHAAMGHDHASTPGPTGLSPAGTGSTAPIVHRDSEKGPQTLMQAEEPKFRLNDPGPGLRDNGRRVLVYGDLRSLSATHDPRDPDREIQLHLTGNMSRYIWGMDGIKFADAEPLRLHYGERVRITLINDTMMYHPIHLHGMWSDLETGDAERIPRKHTISVPPGSKASYLVTADAIGSWAYHCHLLFHMPGMFRQVDVVRGRG